MDKVWFSGFKYHVNLVCHAQHIFTHLISTQSSVRVSIVTQDFSATILEIFKRKNRREVFHRMFGKYIAFNVSRLENCGEKPAPSHHKYTQNFKLNNCAISESSQNQPYF